jgi:hypothetical protein
VSDITDTFPGRYHGIAPRRPHFPVIVSLSGELFGVWIIPERWYRWISDHDSFQVEATVAEISVFGKDR